MPPGATPNLHTGRLQVRSKTRKHQQHYGVSLGHPLRKLIHAVEQVSTNEYNTLGHFDHGFYSLASRETEPPDSGEVS
eukprot:2547930-Amphidinium_carterae.1